jgi:hypothetical protein
VVGDDVDLELLPHAAPTTNSTAARLAPSARPLDFEPIMQRIPPDAFAERINA